LEWVVVGIIVVVILFFFGAKKLPDIARSLQRTPSEFKKGMREGASASEEAETSDDDGEKRS
jgi:sec-independent protein translocase protein TatA